MRDFPPGTVGILTLELTRYSWAVASLMQLQIPDGSQFTWVTGHGIATAVNRIVASMRPEDAWVCLLTDDNPVPADMLLRLLAHDVPLVAPLVHLRVPPFLPSLFHALPDGRFACWSWEDVPPPPGLLPVDTFGGPGVVIRREVIEAVGLPFFENQPPPLGSEDPHEDLYSFNKCRLAGFQPLVDLSLPIGHCFLALGTPVYDPAQGRWGTQVWSRRPLGVLWPDEFTDAVPTAREEDVHVADD